MNLAHPWRSAIPAIVVLMCTAAALDIHALTAQSFWMDEGFSIFMARTDAATFWRFVWGGEVNMAFYYVLLRIWLHFGTSEFWIRFFSVIWAAASVPAVYAIGKRLLGSLGAASAAVLLALHPTAVTFAQEARGYSLSLFLVSLSCLFFLRLLEDKEKLNWAGYVIFSVLAAHTHLFAAFVIASQWVWLVLFFPARLRPGRLQFSVLILFLLLLPLSVIVLSSFHQAADWIPPLTGSGFLQIWPFLALPKWPVLLYVGLWIVAIGAGVSARQGLMYQWRMGFVLFWLFLPIVLTLAISIFKPMLVPRFFLICLPASVLLAASGLVKLPRLAAGVALGALALVSFNSVLSYYRHLGWKEDWRGATSFVVSHCEPGDSVVVIPNYGRFTFDYYRGLEPGSSNSLVYGEWESGRAFPTAAAEHRTWLVISSVGSKLPGAQEGLQDLKSERNSDYVLEDRRLNSLEVWLLAKGP
jgi:mannosyltransferase